MIIISRSQLAILITIAILLLTPIIAMQFTDEVNWSTSDFVIAGALLLATGLLIDFLARKIKQTKYSIVAAIAVLVVLVLVWMELAVGIFGTPLAGS